MRKKRKKFDVGALVREIARETIGMVPGTKVVPNKKRKTGKHKKKELDLESE